MTTPTDKPVVIAYDTKPYDRQYLGAAAGVEQLDLRFNRFRLEPEIVDPTAPCDASYAAIYDVSEAEPVLRRALAESREDGRRVTYPDWFGQIEFASLDCIAISPYVAAPVRR